MRLPRRTTQPSNTRFTGNGPANGSGRCRLKTAGARHPMEIQEMATRNGRFGAPGRRNDPVS